MISAVSLSFTFSSTRFSPSASTLHVFSRSSYVKFTCLPSASFISYPSFSVVTAYKRPSLPTTLCVFPTFDAIGLSPDQNSIVFSTSRSAVPQMAYAGEMRMNISSFRNLLSVAVLFHDSTLLNSPNEPMHEFSVIAAMQTNANSLILFLNIILVV